MFSPTAARKAVDPTRSVTRMVTVPVPSTARAYDPETSGARPPTSERGEAGEESFGVAPQRLGQRAGWIARSVEAFLASATANSGVKG